MNTLCAAAQMLVIREPEPETYEEEDYFLWE